jgi:hypothetical protein
MDSLILRVIQASLKNAEEKSENKVEEKKELDAKGNLYAFVYLTNSYTDDRGGTHTKLEYGKGMEAPNYSREVIEDIGFQNYGDNFRWFRVYWVFNIEDKIAVYQADVDPTGRKTAGNESISYPGEEIRINNNLLKPSDLENLQSFPFDDSGKIKMLPTGQVPLPGQVFFVDGSNNSNGTLDQSKVSVNKLLSMRKYNPDNPTPEEHVSNKNFVGDDLTGNSYRIWDGSKLIKLNGQADLESTKVVKNILSRPPQEEQDSQEKEPEFTPLGEQKTVSDKKVVPPLGTPKGANVQNVYQRVQPNSGTPSASKRMENEIKTTKDRLNSIKKNESDLKRKQTQLKSQLRKNNMPKYGDGGVLASGDLDALENEIKDNQNQQRDLKNKLDGLKRELPNLKREERQQDQQNAQKLRDRNTPTPTAKPTSPTSKPKNRWNSPSKTQQSYKPSSPSQVKSMYASMARNVVASYLRNKKGE